MDSFEIPAICRACGIIFPSRFSGVEGGKLDILSCSVSCPRCGNQAGVLDGVFESAVDVVRALLLEGIDPSRIDAVMNILAYVRRESLAPEQAERIIDKHAPELRGLSGILPRTRVELYAFLAVIVATLSLLRSCSNSDVDPKVIVNHGIINLYNRQ